MIHIDDLFRQRMEDREASPKPGAWGNMRELLDKQMPVAQAATNWRRVFGYFTGVLLFASASVGGYSLYSNQLESNTGTAGKALLASNTNVGDGVKAAAAGNSGSGTSYSASVHSTQAAALAPHSSEGARGVSGNGNADSRTTVPAAPGASGIAALNTQRTTATATSASASGRRHAAGFAPAPKPNSQDDSPANAEPVFSASAAASPRSTRNPTDPTAVPGILNPAPEAADAAATASGPGSAASKTRQSSELPPALNAGNPAGLAVKLPPTTLRVLDTIRRIEIVTRRSFMAGTRRPVYHLDTLPVEYAVIERFLPVPEPAPVASANRGPERSVKQKSNPKLPAVQPAPVSSAAVKTPDVAITPNSAAAAASSDAVNTANSVAAKLSGSKLSFWQSLRLDEKVEAAKASLQSIQLYPGIIAGINATMFTPNSLGGFQLGLTSLIAINDNWSVLGELKYIHRFNTGNTLRDDYTHVENATSTPVEMNGKPYVRYSWDQAKANHYFNFESIQTIELPIAFRYNNDRFFSQAGVNFVSSRPINAREVTNIEDLKAATPAYVPEGSLINPTPTNTKPTVTSSDFGSRLGIGYVFGAGYMFTPSVFIDCRMTQSFWSNASTPGARQISRDLLGRPSFQLSVGYRFGTGKQER